MVREAPRGEHDNDIGSISAGSDLHQKCDVRLDFYCQLFHSLEADASFLPQLSLIHPKELNRGFSPLYLLDSGFKRLTPAPAHSEAATAPLQTLRVRCSLKLQISLSWPLNGQDKGHVAY